jgi:hypothetical protein
MQKGDFLYILPGEEKEKINAKIGTKEINNIQ